MMMIQLGAMRELALLKSVISHMTEGLIVTDDNLDDPRILLVNPAMSKISGYSEDEMLGRGVNILFGTDKDEDLLSEIKQQLKRGKDVKYTMSGYRKNGQKCFIKIETAPVPNEDGEIKYYVSIHKDITQEVSLEKELQEYRNYQISELRNIETAAKKRATKY